MIAAGTQLVNVVLYDAGCNHRSRSQTETPCDFLQWREPNSNSLKPWIQEDIGNGNEDNQSDRVDVVDKIVWSAMQLHRGSLRNQIVGHLIVGQPPNWVPQKDGARFQTSSDFVDPDIVKGHPDWLRLT